jgi:uncharacterized membrane protein YbaN (DUF454 family)
MHKFLSSPIILVGLLSTPIRKDWETLRDHPPGERFERCYRLRRLQERDEATARIFRVILALIIFSVGIGMIFLPLPEIPFFLLSGTLLATESLPFARFLDRNELRLRDAWKRFKRRSGLPPRAIRLITLATAFSALVLSTAFCYRKFIR